MKLTESKKTPKPETRQGDRLDRRQVLLAAATLGVAPWLLSACAQTTASLPRIGASGQAASSESADRRRLGPFNVYPIGMGVQWQPNGPQGVFDLYASSTTREGGMALIRRAADLGVTLFDTAEAYGPLMSEELLGQALQGSRRDRVVMCTKFGFDVDPLTGQRRGGLNSRPEHIRQAVEGQLRRLRTDRIDLLYQHRVDPSVPIEDVVGAIKDLIRQGKVLNYGLSEPGLQTVRRAHREHPVAVIQNEYSMLYRGPEAEVLPLCEELGIGFVAWSPLGMGFLAGNVRAASRFEKRDFRAAVPRFAPDVLPANMALAELVQSWSTRKGATPAQLSLAWLSAQKPWLVPIPGTTSVAHLEENIAAAKISFTAAELKELNAAAGAIRTQGARLSKPVLDATGVEAPPKR